MATCAKCGKPGAANTCGRCKQAKYCSQDCQRAHWKEHKQSCNKKKPKTNAAGGIAGKAPTGNPSGASASSRHTIKGGATSSNAGSANSRRTIKGGPDGAMCTGHPGGTATAMVVRGKRQAR